MSVIVRGNSWWVLCACGSVVRLPVPLFAPLLGKNPIVRFGEVWRIAS